MQLNVLEKVGQARRKGAIQSDLALLMKVAHANFYYIAKVGSGIWALESSLSGFTDFQKGFDEDATAGVLCTAVIIIPDIQKHPDMVWLALSLLGQELCRNMLRQPTQSGTIKVLLLCQAWNGAETWNAATLNCSIWTYLLLNLTNKTKHLISLCKQRVEIRRLGSRCGFWLIQWSFRRFTYINPVTTSPSSKHEPLLELVISATR